MTRVALMPLLLSGILTGCVGEFASQSGDDDSIDPSLVEAKAKWDAEVLPMLVANCQACHVNPIDGKGFMIKAPDEFTTALAHPNLIIGGNPNESRLYAYGRSPNHSGPELTPDQAELVRQFIELVPDSGEPPAQVDTGKVTPQVGDNTIDLGKAGASLAGSSLTFKVTMLASGLYVTDLTAHAGAMGLHIAHPLFVTYCPDAKPDPVDSFYGLDQVMNAAEQQKVGGGTVVLTDWAAGCKIAVLFHTIEPGMAGPGQGDDGGVTGSGGCVNVTSFTANAAGPLSGQCGSCHKGGNAGAKAAFDLSAVDDPSADGQKRACAQTRNKINLNTEANSILFQRVKPGQQTGHPLTLPQAAYDGFVASVTAWAITE